ncbi:MAG: winged helix-turn-helix domain-containing protein [Colwellia sp.]|nr:winged helix-turn-helix domain-containing protein [Colwellia sp.]
MRFLFGDIIVDPNKVKITKNAQPLECEPRVFELLVYFCHNPQKAISRDELVTHVWSGRIVSHAAVNRAIGELRKLIEDKPSSPQWLITVSKVGYRLTIVPNVLASDELEKSVQKHAMPAKIAFKPILNPAWAVTSKWFGLLTALVILLFYILQGTYSSKAMGEVSVSARQPITFSTGNAFNPYYHAETKRLVFLYRANTNAYAQIYMQEGNGPAHAVLNDDYYYTDVLYGADGFIYASRLDDLQQRQCEIVKINPLSKRVSPIVDCGKGVITQLVFDQQRRRLIYRSRPSISEPYAIHSYQLDTGRKQQLSHPEQVGNNTGDYTFAISPNSQKLAIIEYHSADIDKIKILDLNNNRIIASAPLINNVHGLLWHLQYNILASNGNGLFSFDVNQQTVSTIEHSDQFGRLTLGEHNNRIITERSQSTVNVFSFSTDPLIIKPLTASRGLSLGPVLGSSSDILAFKSNRTGEKKIFIQPKGRAAFIAEFDGTIEYISAMAWSADDEKLVASINDVLYLYSLNTKNWQRIAKDYTRVHHVTFVGESILFSAEIDEQWNIWQLSVDNEQAQQVTTRGGYSIQGNDSKLYFTKFNYDGLYQLDLSTKTESIVIKDFPIIGWRHWQLRNDKIFYLFGNNYQELNLNTEVESIVHKFAGRKPNSCHTAYQEDFFVCEQVEFSTSNIWKFQLSQK